MQSYKVRPRRPSQQLLILMGLLVLASLAGRWTKPAAVDGGRLEGYARLVDGDSFFMGSDEVRLQGIDAPEGRQTCTRGGKDWPCGEAAKRELARLIGGRQIVCDGVTRDQHNRMLANCKAGGIELNAAMVANGFAVRFGARYGGEERAARDAKRGLWAGEFERPQDWRHRNGIGR